MTVSKRIYLHQEGKELKFDTPPNDTNKEKLHGEHGFIKTSEGKGWRTVTIQDAQGKKYHVDKGSLIKFLNAQNKNHPKLKLKFLDKTWLIGTSNKKVLETFDKFKAAVEGREGSYVIPIDKNVSDAIIARHTQGAEELKTLKEKARGHNYFLHDFSNEFHVLLEAIKQDPSMKSDHPLVDRTLMRNLNIEPHLALKHAPTLLLSLKDNQALIQNPKLRETWSQACYTLGFCLMFGNGFDKNVEEGVRFLNLASEQGNVKAQIQLGHYYSLSGDKEKAVEYIRLAASQGDPDAQSLLANFYERGFGVEPNQEEADRLKLLAKAGKEKMQALRKPTDQPPVKMRKFLNNFGELIKLINIGSLKIKLPDDERALLEKWNKENTLNLAETLQVLQAIETNKVLANTPGINKIWAEACCNLGLCFLSGEGCQKDINEGLRIIRLAESDTKTQMELAYLYREGAYGVPKDGKEAVKFYQKAAKQGDVDAIFQLGRCHEKGIGVPKDGKEAALLYRLAMDKGSQAALTALVDCYGKGLIAVSDKEEVAGLFKSAIKTGYNVAKQYLKALEEA